MTKNSRKQGSRDPSQTHPVRSEADAPSMKEAALAYAAIGWPVFPCQADKTPLIKNWQYDATTDPGQVDRYLDVMVAQMIRGANSRQHEQLRGIDRSAGQDDLSFDLDLMNLALVLIVQAGRPVSLNPKSIDHRIGLECEVASTK